MKHVFIGLAAAIFGFIAVSALSGGEPGTFDYINASEADQQRYLESVTRGFRAGFKKTAGKTAEIVNTKAMAGYDLVTVDIVLKHKKFESASVQQIESYRKHMYKNSCKTLGKQKLLDAGITVKLRMKRAKGGSFANFKFDDEICSRFGA